MMDVAKLQIKRAQVRLEFDALVWRKRRLDERLDRLAKEMDEIESEITIAKLQHHAAEIPQAKAAGKMEMV